MTIAEVLRESEGIAYRQRTEAKIKANFDYTQALLIGRVMSIVLSGKGKTPKFEEAYKFVYTEEELQKLHAEEQARRLKKFVSQYNAKHMKGDK